MICDIIKTKKEVYMYKQIEFDNELWDYYVYDDGRIYSLKSKKFLSPDTSTGYARVLLCHNGIHKRFNVHKLVGLFFIPNPENLPIINHKDNNILNNHVDNLEWISYSDNVKSENCIKHEKIYASPFTDDELKTEEWKSFRDGRYFISNLGRLKNSDNNKILSGHINPVTVYIRDNLFFRDGSKQTIPRHHIVWEAFHPNEEIEVLNHKDGDKTNNRLSNLENISRSENLSHAYKVLKSKKTRKCCGVNINSGEIKIFFSISEAAQVLRCQESTIRTALNRQSIHKSHISQGYKWYNLTENEYEQALKSSETIESIIREKDSNE